MSNIEEDIKGLKNCLAPYQKIGFDSIIAKRDNYYKALENVLAELESKDKRIKELEDDLYSANCIISDLTDSIPVQKVKDKIEEIKEDKESKYFDTFLMARDINYAIDILEELLEDKKYV